MGQGASSHFLPGHTSPTRTRSWSLPPPFLTSGELRTASCWWFQDYHQFLPQVRPRHRLRRIYLFLLIQQIREVPKGLWGNCSEGVVGNCNRDGVPEWLEDFTENLEIAAVLAPADISQDSDPECLTKVGPRKHSIETHFPTDQNCEVCKRTKMTRARCRRRTWNSVIRAQKFGDLITADHKVLDEGGESRNNHRYAVVVQDLATQWIQSYPCKTKTTQKMDKSLRKFLEPSEKPIVIYTDNSVEFGKSCEDFIMESSYYHTPPIRDEWDCRKSSTQSQGRDVCCTIALRLE